MLITFTEYAKSKKIVINLDNVTHIMEHDLGGTVFYFESGQVRVQEKLDKVLEKFTNLI